MVLNITYRRKNVLPLLCLTVLLSGCSSQPVVKTEYLFPPSIYLVPCERTPFTGTTYGDAIQYLRKVQYERDVCASKVEGVISWEKKYRMPLSITDGI
ncbi:Rz1-like lysis system protein LysC [Chelonobacter oris]|uniref:Rz1-like lysis system protein LysC n=1 Tax=Chelonobacter oris TaxID=505317 RepID=UPI003CC5FA81